MNSHPVGSRTSRGTTPWALILGLAALALLWPLIALTGIRAAIGNPVASLLVITVVAALWIGVVGIGRVPRPVRTLTLVGLIHGVITQLISLIAFDIGPVDTVRPLWTVLPALLMSTLWGFLAGLAAAGVQRLRGADRR